MRNPLIAKLEHGAALTDEDRSVLAQLSNAARRVGARQMVIREGERPEMVHVVLDGFACRYNTLPGGNHQITALLLPGDLCNLHVAMLDTMDHSIATLSTCSIVALSPTTISEVTEHHPRIARALWWCTLVEEGTLRAWIAGLGQRNAVQRLAHLLCELLVRLQAVGHADENSYAFSLRQAEIGEVLGLSPVHVNRSLQHLRQTGFITAENRRMTIHDPDQLKAYCGFDPHYLHLTKRSDRS